MKVGKERTTHTPPPPMSTAISAKVPGYIRDLPTEDYERVRKGQVLAQLIDDDYKAAVSQATANLSSAQAQSLVLRAQRELQLANLQAARAVEVSTQAQITQNTRDLSRQRRLLDTGSSSLKPAKSSARLERSSTLSYPRIVPRCLRHREHCPSWRRSLRKATRPLRPRAPRSIPRQSIWATHELPRLKMVCSVREALSQGNWWGWAARLQPSRRYPVAWVIANFKGLQLTLTWRLASAQEIRVDSLSEPSGGRSRAGVRARFRSGVRVATSRQRHWQFHKDRSTRRGENRHR